MFISSKPVSDNNQMLHYHTEVNFKKKSNEERFESNEDDDYEEKEMNEYDEMNEKFDDVNETMGEESKGRKHIEKYNIKTSKRSYKISSNPDIVQAKHHNIELDLWKDAISQGKNTSTFYAIFWTDMIRIQIIIPNNIIILSSK